ncbi:Thymidylate kinase [Patulibacter medicamentivorans]|uniref:Thymidylate kinase n=1 Tax=Patulibacter medicamentivorans TaxID=1097667 RepID=H0E848_9ACTN|nr:thioredoxin domain-containing protein [Patulibacter medicamentivorans]EHN10113.1 Thymidylate kinase [Patulibacter medicamentivorans]
MPNALAAETSPYLLQHAENPVDWLPWGPEALERARREDKPLLVSIGYSACHWCHVMAHESFEDPATASVMNAHFVCVKVDREERPDVDAICMEAVQAITGQGGWPLNVFLTPEQQPIHGGTYFPPQPRQGMPSWRMVLDAVAEAWRERSGEIREQLSDVADRLSGASRLTPADAVPGPELLDAAVRGLGERYDSVQGGFGGAPKFPPHPSLLFLLQRAADERPGEDSGTAGRAAAMARHTLRSMASGGINDQIGGGFARYAVDGTWTVPHFEKMLYDNALLARAYVEGFRLWGDERLRETAERTLAFLADELRGPEGGFLSALDADSEGVEGRFYVWTPEQVRAALSSADAEAAIAWLGVTEHGNFEDGATVLEDRGERPDDETVARIRAGLLAARSQRIRPGTDDKRVAGWNGLAIHAFAEASAVLGREDLLEVARRAAAFVRRDLTVDGRLRRTWSDRETAGADTSGHGGRARHAAVLEDHGFLLEAAVALFEAGGDPEDLAWARELADTILNRFADPERGAFFATADDAEALLVRRKELDDAPIPSGGASASRGLLRLAALTGEARYADAADGWLRLAATVAERIPQAVAYALLALDERHRPPREVAIVGPPAARAALVAVVRERSRPGLVLAVGDGLDDRGVALLRGRPTVDGQATAYVCERFSCRAPVTEPDALRAALAG